MCVANRFSIFKLYWLYHLDCMCDVFLPCYSSVQNLPGKIGKNVWYNKMRLLAKQTPFMDWLLKKCAWIEIYPYNAKRNMKKSIQYMGAISSNQSWWSRNDHYHEDSLMFWMTVTSVKYGLWPILHYWLVIF